MKHRALDVRDISWRPKMSGAQTACHRGANVSDVVTRSITAVVFASVLVLFASIPGVAKTQCPEEPPLQNYTGAGLVVCPCFVPGEEAGAVLDAPANHYPLEILRVGIGWASQFGGSPQSLEQGINIYAAGLPNPGTPVFTLPGPVLNDGFINEFDLEPLPGEIAINSGPFTVTLEFLNSNVGDPFAPSVVHDGNGCQTGKNVVFAIPGGWTDACLLGVTGDWVFYVIYRPCLPATGIGEVPHIASSSPVLLMPATPNPFTSVTEFDFFLAEPGRAKVSVYDVTGHRVAALLDQDYPAGTHRITWNGAAENSERLPSGMYFVRLEASGHQSVRKVLLTK